MYIKIISQKQDVLKYILNKKTFLIRLFLKPNNRKYL